MTKKRRDASQGITSKFSLGSLAQLVEQLAFNQLVARSNRARPTNKKGHP
jgi:hypothetical protein